VHPDASALADEELPSIAAAASAATASPETSLFRIFMIVLLFRGPIPDGIGSDILESSLLPLVAEATDER